MGKALFIADPLQELKIERLDEVLSHRFFEQSSPASSLPHEKSRDLRSILCDNRAYTTADASGGIAGIVVLPDMGYVDEVLFGREVVERLPCNLDRKESYEVEGATGEINLEFSSSCTLKNSRTLQAGSASVWSLMLHQGVSERGIRAAHH